MLDDCVKTDRLQLSQNGFESLGQETVKSTVTVVHNWSMGLPMVIPYIWSPCDAADESLTAIILVY